MFEIPEFLADEVFKKPSTKQFLNLAGRQILFSCEHYSFRDVFHQNFGVHEWTNNFYLFETRSELFNRSIFGQ